MKLRTLMPAVLAAFSTTAFAANVELYGIVDAYVQATEPLSISAAAVKPAPDGVLKEPKISAAATPYSSA